MSTITRLVELLAGHYRWGLHPFKLFIALVLPVTIVWLGDRQLRALSETIDQQERKARRLPRIRRR